MQRPLMILTAGALLLAAPAFAQNDSNHAQHTPSAAVTLPIHPQSHWELGNQKKSDKGRNVYVDVDKPSGLSELSTLSGRREEHPPDPGHIYQYNQPFYPLVSF